MTLRQRIRYLLNPPKGLTPLRLDAKQCQYAFSDMEGKAYFRIPVDTHFPLERHAKRSEICQWMSSGLSSSELDKLIDIASDEMEKLVAGKKGSLVKVGAVLHEMKERKSLIVHHDLLYQFVAVHYIREDEKVNEYSDEIQQQKIEAFKRMVAGGRSLDFFHLPELVRIRQITEMSSEQFIAFWNESIREQSRMNQKLEALKSGFKSPIKSSTTTEAS